MASTDKNDRRKVDEPPIRAVVEPVFGRSAPSPADASGASPKAAPQIPSPPPPATSAPLPASDFDPPSSKAIERRLPPLGGSAPVAGATPMYMPPTHSQANGPSALPATAAATEHVAAAGASNAASSPPPLIKRPPKRPPPLPRLRAWLGMSVEDIDAEHFEQGRMARVRDMGLWISGIIRDVPAWMVSMVVHLILLLILGLWPMAVEETEPGIVLSMEFAKYKEEGEAETIEEDEVIVEPEQVDPDVEPDPDELPSDDPIDLPIPEEYQPTNEEERQALEAADKDADELRIDPDAPHLHLPDIAEAKSRLQGDSPRSNMTHARDPRLRAEIVSAEGGTLLTEAAVARGLRWLSNHQFEAGNWSLHRFHHAGPCDGRCGNAGTVISDTAATSLALVAFLGAGQTHRVGVYSDRVERGLDWLLEQQGSNGHLFGNSVGNSSMYAHALATIALSEAYAMTPDDQRLREPAQRAVDFIVYAQHAGGGWRYRPKMPGDTSVLGWQLIALQSARAAQLDVPQSTLDGASRFLDNMQTRSGSQYRYVKRRKADKVMTAEGLLCRVYLGWDRDHAPLNTGVNYLTTYHLPAADDHNIYYWYYGSQLMHHYGGPQWQQWNTRMRDILVESQQTEGHEAGSWQAVDVHSAKAGRLYETALSICTLEVYYRHLPIFRRIDLGE